ncbi:iron-siderophore ABC transporter substrate-binding protein [Paenibacillus chitinolyticus]|uniref:Iron-siderophore ABC transporter substrate-binding protein n=1 Tax=Paenibacillus chitinolyticus TaxID=79263 RepID=A0A410WT21_9BACL|nr:iron-siderophore ABC transporter substrate-binding protein [Paenibacillus chitinolyticus]MCY9588860.1 iron-siderophore ABC transporter substrate-binding protein [Paenibacillus chitinolyticus]MCY9595636.1 iron-siderophore ABC transporter substrate-binding protein [Paenibacillus chitinolyticus]QAV17397.1 iron-siderophore ABC transporter substrate-binding protein [Paenibacillus chitinolyticus]
MKSAARKSYVLCLIVLAMALALAGCGKGNQASDGGAASPAPGDTAKQTIKVKHAMGETDVPAAPKRVVILTNEGTEALLALGIKPVGAVKSFTGNPWYDHIKADMEGVTVVGDEHQPNMEAIISLKPDLIIGNKMRQEKVYAQLSAIAPTVFSETLRGEWKNNFSLYAEAVNKKADGEKVIADFDKRIEDFKSKAGDKLKEKVSVVRFMAGKTRIYLDDTFTGIIFKQIGIARTPVKAKDTFVEEITKERVPEVDSDRLFYFTYETGDGNGTKQEEAITKDPLWQNLNVVKNGKTQKVNDVTWNTAGGVRAANLLLDDLYKFYDIK